MECEYRATSKVYLTKHEKAVHVNADNLKKSQGKVYAGFVMTKCLRIIILVGMIVSCIRRLQMDIFLNIKRLCMKNYVSNNIASN